MRRHLIPIGAIVGLVSAALVACGSAGDGTAGREPSGAPPPPLPTSLPVDRLDSVTALASHDGAVVVDLVDDRVVFRHGDTAGAEPAGVAVGPGAELRALAADGSLAALLIPLPDDRTRIVVVADPAGTAVAPVPGASQTIELGGLVEPEAFATDGSLLFVVDHRAGSEPGTYRIRPLDLATGTLLDALGPTKVPLDEDMTGRGVRQVWSPDGTRLYTLYLRQSPHGGGGGTVGLIHVLDLVEEWAYCVDLPSGFGSGPAGSAALAVSPDSPALVVIDTAVGQIAVVDTANLIVAETHPLPAVELPGISPTGSGSEVVTIHLAVTADHLAVAAGDRLAWLDRVTLTPIGAIESLRSPVRGLTSQEGSVLVWPAGAALDPYLLTPPSAA